MATRRKTALQGEPFGEPVPSQADGKPPAYAIFEGGGAKGITHIGALKALRDRYWLVGAAGASAGAIIAALAAVGFRATELFDDQKKTDILAAHGTSPVGLLGSAAWRRLQIARRWLPLSLSLAVYAVAAFAWLAIAGADWTWLALVGLLFVSLLIPIATLAFPVVTKGGFLSTDSMRDKLDEILRARLQLLYKRAGLQREIGPYVTFEDMAPETINDACRLRIVVTDASNRELIQFDEKTPNVSVADAVAASAALPIVFRPPRIRGLDEPAATSVFVDGGLVSNLPVWAFISEKKIFERGVRANKVPIFAFTLNAPVEGETPAEPAVPHEEGIPAYLRELAWTLAMLAPRAVMAFLRFVESALLLPFRIVAKLYSRFGGSFSIMRHLRDVIESGIFGSQTVVQEFVPDLHVVDMASPLTTVAFDCDRAAASKAYRAGLERASECLTKWERESETTAELLATLLPDIQERLAAQRRVSGRPGSPRLRLSIVDQLRPGFFQVTASLGMDEDADDRMEYDPSSAAAPAVFRDKVATLAPFDESKKSVRRAMTKYERALLRQDRRSVISVPVYRVVGDAVPESLEDRVVERVLCVDSDDDLQEDFGEPTFINWLGGQAMILARFEGE